MNKSFKIGIITMHRVRNNGSALQAYALQTKVDELGYDSEIIDYVFPNKTQIKVKGNKLIWLAKKIIYLTLDAILGFPNYTQLKRLSQFHKEHYKLSTNTYLTKEELENNPPKYDLLITGSDQVWNYIHIGDDTSFMLSFCTDDNIPRISYAASFSATNLPDKFKTLYSKYLSKYQCISVRENSGIKIITELIQEDANVVCDPTLLFGKEEWSKIAATSKIKRKQPYILAYILHYAYNPYPEINRIISNLQNQLGLHVVYLDGKLSNYKQRNSTVIRNAGPNEFVRLFMDAQFVITTSFHGTAFALNFSIPLYSVIDTKSENDSRMLNLLNLVGAENRLISIDTLEFKAEPMNYGLIDKKVNDLRTKSLEYLNNSISKNLPDQL